MRKILALLALTAAVVSCHKGVDNPPGPTQKRVTISPTITLATSSTLSTRATELSFEQGDRIGVTIIKEDQAIHADNAMMTYTDGVFAGNVDWYEGTAASNMTAYYPYSSAGMPASFSVGTDQRTGYGKSDLMGAVKGDATPSGDAVGMTFYHLLSKILVNVVQTDENITSVVLQNSIPTATVDLENLSATADPAAQTADITAQTVTANAVYRAVIVPQTVALSIAVTSAGGSTYTHKLASAALKGGGQYAVNIKIADGKLKVTMNGEIDNWTNGDEIENEIDPNPDGATAYITKVLDFMPAVGQFTNALPAYQTGDTQETMNQKVLSAIGNNARGMISLGGFGGYVTVGFDHTIANVPGKRDFRVIANAFFADANPNPDAPLGGSCEPGVIVVSYDANKNGVADDPWYEIAGSAHEDPSQELWYQMAVNNGNNVSLYRNYSITYHRPESEPAREDWDTYIRWEDNKGNSGYKVKNQFHTQPYFPQWAGNSLTLSGTCLPQNGIDESGAGNYYVLYKFRYGYADNDPNNSDDAAIDIDWAVDAAGEKVHLPGVDFIKIYTGVNQENGWLGECSTELTGIEDLHVLGVNIATRQ